MPGRLAPGAPTRWARRLALGAHVALLVALPALAQLTGALCALPLLVPLPGLVRGRPYTYAWASMLVVFYAAGLLVAAKSGAGPQWLALAILAALEFCALVLFVRFSRVDLLRRGTDAS
jgi:uncharacterized membrane protein